MKNSDKALQWLRRAKSNIARAQVGIVSPDILYEDLCFDVQQAVEKSLKAFCVYRGIVFPKTHDIGYLLELLEKTKITIPAKIREASLLTDYAVELRYPGDYEPVEEDEYKNALKIMESVFKWVEKKVK